MKKPRLSLAGLNPNKPLSDQLTVKNAIEFFASMWVTTSYLVLPDAWVSGTSGEIVAILWTALGIGVVYTIISIVEFFFSEVDVDVTLETLEKAITEEYEDGGKAE